MHGNFWPHHGLVDIPVNGIRGTESLLAGTLELVRKPSGRRIRLLDPRAFRDANRIIGRVVMLRITDPDKLHTAAEIGAAWLDLKL